MAGQPEILEQIGESFGAQWINDFLTSSGLGILVLLFVTAVPVFLQGPDKVQWRRFLIKCALVTILVVGFLAWHGFDIPKALMHVRWFCYDHYFIVGGLFALGIGFQYTLWYILVPKMVGLAAFSASEWLKNDRLIRSRMVHDLIKKYDDQYVTLKDLKEMLGEPDYIRETDQAMVYDLDCERRLAIFMPTSYKELKIKMVLE
ncbi:MAG TPA: hypothetical protein PKO06_05155 [Candidatus Ozemobacteraceae bacterium]|nr:hypothetical protein [Candidatus Ozemobacteraceae bacterium]